MKGRKLFKLIIDNHLNFPFTSHPTNASKIPDLLDFFIYKGISKIYIATSPNYDLPSDHSGVIATLSA